MTTETTEWDYEYLPYTETAPDGAEREVANYRIFSVSDTPEDYIAQTNEDLPDDVQESHALLIRSAPQLFDALEYFFNIMHDYKSSLEKGYVEFAMDQARAVLAQAKEGSGI